MNAATRPAFMTALPRADLFDAGVIFPAHELTRRVLSLFWRDCCCPPVFSRAPAPVVRLDEPDGLAAARSLQAWWLMEEGIVEESEGPYAERLRPFFGGPATTARLWPRYEFCVLADPFAVEMRFHREGSAVQGHRTRLFVQPDGRVRVLEREPWWVTTSA